jgi:hypothetical protein
VWPHVSLPTHSQTRPTHHSQHLVAAAVRAFSITASPSASSMKRRGEAETDQQRQRRAMLSLPEQPSVGAAVPSLALCDCAADDSSASGLSLQAISSRASIPSLSALERVNGDVLVLILQWLTAHHKLAAVSRLSRAFHPVPTRAFLHDSPSSWLPPYIHWVEEDVRLRQHQHLSVEQGELAGTSTLFTCPRSIRSVPQLAALQSLTIEMHIPAEYDGKESLRCFLCSVLSLPSLVELVVEPPWSGPKYTVADWTDPSLPAALRFAISLFQGWRYLSPPSCSSAPCG